MYKSIFIPLSSNGDQAPVLAFGAAMADALDAQVECVFSSKSMTLIQEEQSEQVAAMYKKEGYVASQKLIVELYQHQFKTRAKQVSEWFQLCKEKLAGGKHLAWRGSFELFDESVEQIRNECSFHDIPITLHDAKHRRSAALSDGGYQGEKLAASIKGAKVCIAAVTASKNSHGC